MANIILILHDIRSCHNVGSVLRSAECFGVNEVIFSGYTPYPKIPNDTRLPHIADKISKAIQKTALGAEKLVHFRYQPDIKHFINELRSQGFEIVALEQSVDSMPIRQYVPARKVALILGREVEGVAADILQLVDAVLEIDLFGKKESLNVSVAAGIALFELKRYYYDI
jgi:23S rRNA (guanosine2251-2'-O)-methyltransferase